MLGLLLLPIFSSSESLYASNDPNKQVTELITFIVKKAGENSAYICEQIGEYIKNNCEEIYKQGAEFYAKHPQAVDNAVGSLVTTAVIGSGNAVYGQVCPKKEDEAHKAEADVRIKEAKKRSDFLDAEANFSTCLKKVKKDSVKNAAGIPIVCEDFARALTLCDGDYRVAEMMTNFNK